MDVDNREAAMDQSIDAEEESARQLPPDASETVYVKNLNEKVKVPVIKQSLQALFSSYGTVLSVTAHRNVRMRGQAFIQFDGKEPAAKAVKEVVGFPLYGKPMQVAFARTKSDSFVDEVQGKDALEEHKKERLERKKHARTAWRRKVMTAKLAAQRGEGDEGQPKRQVLEMPEEYLPPNKILFLHNVPESVGKQDLDALFRTFEGLVDVRLIPGRGVAFVEYGDSMQSAAARDALSHHALVPGHKLRITFAK